MDTKQMKKLKKLHDFTGARVLDCKKALLDCDGDFHAAVLALKGSGLTNVGPTKAYPKDKPRRINYGYMYNQERTETYGRMIDWDGGNGYRWEIYWTDMDGGPCRTIVSGHASSEEAAKASLDSKTGHLKLVR